jgi:hypothetical protein|tara:strand:+ start:100 stop:690 length:591 start_codon:yes stop_codon:yes gene_type:complete
MSKRSHMFPRRERDFYPTPVAAVAPLIPHLPERFTYIEPCCGDGALVRALASFEGVAHDGRFCPTLEYASDIAPSGDMDARTLDVFQIEDAAPGVDLFVTNPPWRKKSLHRIIVHLSDIRPTWMLFYADWMHTKQASQYMHYCRKIVSVGRVSWMGNGVSSFDNCAWYLFDYGVSLTPTEFWGRSDTVAEALRDRF